MKRNALQKMRITHLGHLDHKQQIPMLMYETRCSHKADSMFSLMSVSRSLVHRESRLSRPLRVVHCQEDILGK